jgi:hypothetical protein
LSGCADQHNDHERNSGNLNNRQRLAEQNHAKAGGNNRDNGEVRTGPIIDIAT